MNLKGVKEGLRPSSFSVPLSFKGEGDTGGEVDNTGGLFDAISLVLYTELDRRGASGLR